ncbi:MAG: hypothetical protein ACD_65C00346G0006 [uncultured bacterium]|nr:MAG: hypothetical protein ACD_65C00346G0006 [uncultured bacterium]KKT02592.1 MAG: cyclic nucleotide-binding domain-containing protein [Candidatus Peregrinibacteria bacterium GW2011_GWF2_43_17]KKT20587.1 MAG: Cyclic nucleotide-binding domain protein [Candidatus Peregrinibacteria bacterium GW2011_GWA2_43_8]HAU39894.1 hypothetical protein [Candidatus Peregrinibacteria bacterium]
MTEFSILPILKQIPLFATLDEKIHDKIIKDITMQYYPAGYQLFEEGNPAGAMYILKSGVIQIYKGNKEIAKLGKGSFFGEMALVSDLPRNASAKVIEDAEVFILKKSDFDALLVANDEARKIIENIVKERYSENK